MLYEKKTYDGFVYEVTRTGDLFLVTVLSGQRQIGRCKGALVDAHLNGAVVKAMALGAVFTEPEYRRRGIAAKLLQVFCDFAAAHHLAFLTLEVRPSNAAAIALYESFGFTERGRRRNYYDLPKEDALILTRDFG